MKPRPAFGRKLVDRVVKVTSAAAACLGLAALGWILCTVVTRGAAAINWDFFTKLPTPPGVPGGGLANCLVGTVLMTLAATAVGVPLGLMSAVYLAEFGGRDRFAESVRFAFNILMGTPSIIVGVFIFALLVKPAGHFSGFAGAAALGVLMLPIVARTSEDILALVPNTLRESALALGAPRWRVTLGVVFRAARKGLLTGALLAVARVSGETAPLLFTALNSPYWTNDLKGPTANLTVTIFNYAMSPYADWQQMAWGAALVITLGVLLVTIVSRLALKTTRRTQ